MKKTLILLIALAFMATVICSGCASRQGRPESESLEEAVTKYYTYKKDMETRKAYEYEHLSTTAEDEDTTKEYMSRSASSGMVIYDFEILEIGEEGSGTRGYTPVKMKVTTSWPKIPNMFVPEGKREAVIEDLWVKKNGKWYHMIRGLSRVW